MGSNPFNWLKIGQNGLQLAQNGLQLAKGIHGAGTPEIDTVWDYKADGVLFEGALA